MLDLGILTAYVHNLSALVPIYDIARAIDRLRIVLVEWILDEGLLCLLPVVIIAKCQGRASYAEFALLVDACLTLLVCQDEHTTIATGLADGQRLVVSKLTIHLIVGAIDRDLRRTVEVGIPTVGQILAPVVQMFVGHHLACEEDIFQIGHLLILQHVVIGHVDEGVGYPEHKRDLVLVHVIHQLRGEGEMNLGNDIKGGTRSIHQVDVECRVVEIEWCLVTDHGITCEAEPANGPVDVVYHTTVRDDHSLRGARRT